MSDMKQIFAAIFYFISLSLVAQNFESSWIGHFSYSTVNSISTGNDKIYAAADNTAFSYDLSTNQIETFSTINGLSGEIISTSYYSDTNNLFIIGYENGLIEIILDGEENILTVVDILDQENIPPNQKRINHFHEFNNKVYIATGYGVSVYDLQLLEFGDTFILGDGGTNINVAQTSVLPPFIYIASTEGGIRRALVNDPNIIDFDEWDTLIEGNYKGLQLLGEQVYVLRDDNAVFNFTINDGFTLVRTYPQNVRAFTSFNDILSIGVFNRIEAFAPGFVLQATLGGIPDQPYSLFSGIAIEEVFYIGTRENGMLAVPFGTNQATQILPDGPILNTAFAIDTSPGQLWVNYGDVDVDFNPFPLSRRGISNLREGVWTNIPFSELFDANDLVNISINPNDPNEVYMTSFNKGLLKIEDLTPSILFDDTNSPLESFRDELDIRLFGSDYDSQGNLWFVQSRVPDGLIRLSPTGQFQKIDLTDILPQVEQELALSEVAVSREGFVFLGATQSGLIGYNPQGGQFNLINDTETNGNLPTNNIRALAFDLQNRLWIGTLQGLRRVLNPSAFFDPNANVESQPIIILDEETGVGQELLESQSITDIEVDGSNNKWIATSTSGVFYVSPNGQQTLLRFTTDNSPLPSNNVEDIAVDPFTGIVYFATVNGLVAFKGSATAPRDDLEGVFAFPNPVRPGFTGNVTIDGLMANANVKITDIEGNLVHEQTTQGGSIQWDTTAFGRYKVRSGVYLVIITSDDTLNTAVAKIMIIR